MPVVQCSGVKLPTPCRIIFGGQFVRITNLEVKLESVMHLYYRAILISGIIGNPILAGQINNSPPPSVTGQTRLTYHN